MRFRLLLAGTALFAAAALASSAFAAGGRLTPGPTKLHPRSILPIADSGWVPLVGTGGAHEPAAPEVRTRTERALSRPKRVTRLDTGRLPAGIRADAGPQFQGQVARQGNFVYWPADVQLAVGAGDVVQMVNAQMEIWTTSGTPLKTITLRALTGSGDHLVDPRVIFDAASGRWFVGIMDGTDGHYGIMLGVSQSSDPTGAWWFWTFNSQACLDQPRLGISANLISLTANSYPNCTSPDSRFAGTEIWAVDKAQAMTGGNLSYSFLDPNLGFFSLTPVQALSASPVQHMAKVQGSSLLLVTLTGLPPNVTYSTATTPIAALDQPNNAIQPGTNELLNVDDDRTLDAVWQNGTIWAAANDTCLPPGDSVQRSCARLVTATTSPLRVVDDRDLTLGPGTYVFYPAIRPDGVGNLDLAFGYSSANDYASVGVATKPVAGPWQTWFALAKGNAAQTSTRWGDYFGAATDPAVPDRVWISGQYSTPIPGAQNGYGWGTIIGTITAAPAAVPAVSYSPPSAVDVTGTSATLKANVNPQGSGATVHFEYGTTAAYGLRTPDQSVPSGSAFQAVTAQISNLTANTTYHFRLSATNGRGSAVGIDQTFTTPTGADRIAPVAHALTSKYRAGKVSKLMFTLGDDSGEARITETVYNSANKKIGSVATGLTNGVDGSTFYVTWTPPRTAKGQLRHCVQAWDRAGNASARSCAAVRPG